MKGLGLTATVLSIFCFMCVNMNVCITVILQHGFGSVTKTQVYY